MSDETTFGNFIRARRQGKGLSLREVARRLKTDPTYLSRVERDLMAPPVEKKVRRLARVLGCDVDDLLARAQREKRASQTNRMLAHLASMPPLRLTSGPALSFPETGPFTLQALGLTGTQLDRAMVTLTREIVEGLRHGSFEFTVTGEEGKGGARTLNIRAGKNYRFRISSDELA